MANVRLDDLLKPLLLKDLRIQCRARGVNPGGSREALMERVKDHMLETGNYELVREFNGEVAVGIAPPVAQPRNEDGGIGINDNNYSRSEGQNVGNFITDRPSSRVLAPPGGAMSWNMNGDMDHEPAKPKGKQYGYAPPQVSVSAHAAPAAPVASHAVTDFDSDAVRGEPTHNNNYSRSQGQNVGNFLTDKPSSRVLAPPGGGSSIVFG